jgi:hypothetical protein
MVTKSASRRRYEFYTYRSLYIVTRFGVTTDEVWICKQVCSTFTRVTTNNYDSLTALFRRSL